MPRYLVHHEGRYHVWSTVVMGAITEWLTPEQLAAWRAAGNAAPETAIELGGPEWSDCCEPFMQIRLEDL